MIRSLFPRPKHTAESVARMLIQGLEDGSVVVGDASDDKEATSGYPFISQLQLFCLVFYYIIGMIVYMSMKDVFKMHDHARKVFLPLWACVGVAGAFGFYLWSLFRPNSN